ncbi:MAG: hypothetical protein E7459_05595 [Ruminococcaceae bacterium]|nr:hypothetical protein [Oscillospiraceae bacterium]
MPQKTIDCFSLPMEKQVLLSLAMGNEKRTIPDGLSQERFLALSKKERLLPLIAARIRRLPMAEQTPFQQLLAEQSSARLHAVEQMRILAFLMRDFARSGIQALSLKGPMLAISLYGDPAMRYSRDLDILVDERDLQNACARLEAMGFTEVVDKFHKTPKRRAVQERGGEEMHRVYIRGGICVELHWRLTFRYHQTFSSLWERHTVRKLLGEDVYCLNPTDELIYLICHGAGHGFSRLRWLVDLYERLGAADTDLQTLYDRMAELKVESLLLETLMLLKLLPGFRFPDVKLPRFSMTGDGGQLVVCYDASLRACFRHSFRMLRALHPLLLMEGEARGMAERKYLRLLPTINKKKTPLGNLWALMQPCAADLERFDFPDRLYFLYYIVRPVYKLWRMSPFYRRGQDGTK